MNTETCRLSVNINKVALLRNARGGALPNLIQFAQDCERFGAQGITVHPRPDQRHIRYSDLPELKSVVTTEFNIEGYPSQDFIDRVMQIQPHQVTLVPDAENQLTSDHGWDTLRYGNMLRDIVQTLQQNQIRVSLFLDANPALIESAAQTGTHRIELYTGPYAESYAQNPQKALEPYVQTAQAAARAGLGINAGHDLNLHNLNYFYKNIHGLAEVSIGHALISDALYLGIENTIVLYKNQLNPTFSPQN